MKKNKKSNNIGALIKFELLYKSAFMIIMIPLIEYAFKLSIKASGFSYVTLQNLGSFLAKPFTMISVLFGMLAAGILIYLELISLSIYYEKRKTINDMKILHIIYSGFAMANHVIRQKKCRLLPFFSLLSAAVFSLPAYAFMLSRQRLALYVFKGMMSNQFVCGLILVLLAACYLIVYKGGFVIPLCCFYQLSFRDAYRLSCRKVKQHRKRLVGGVLAANAGLLVFYVAVYYGIIILCGAVTYFIFPDPLRRAAFLIVYDFINRYFAFAICIFGVLYNLKLLKRYMELLDVPAGHKSRYLEIKEVTENIVAINLLWEEKTRGKKSVKLLKAGVVLAICGLLFLALNLNNSMLFQKSSWFEAEITAHRGYSSKAPENTLPAVQAAIDSMSDYVEIDVQETKDGVVIVLHDSNLKRTHGVNKNVYNMNYYELEDYKLPYYTEGEMKTTGIPTLEQVLSICQNKIKLNIELKMNSHEQGLPEKVAAIIKEYDMEEDCIISSTSLNGLSRIKKADSAIKTGYIISLAYGFYYNVQDVDFFSVKSSFISVEMINIVHSYGKEVHAWTVNSEAEAERMKQLGVDNIITDYPVRIREAVYGTEFTETFFEYLKLLTK